MELRGHRFALLGAIVALVIACGGGVVTSSAPTSPGPSDAPSASSSTSASAPVEPVTIQWWGWNPSAEVAQKLIDRFEAANPNITVKYSFAAYEDYLNKLKLAMAAGSGPDVLALQPGALVNQYGEFLDDLSPRAAQDWGPAWPDRFYALGLDQLRAGDRTNALPLFVSAAGYLWANNTLLARDGLEAPKTLDEFVAQSKALQAQGKVGLIFGAKDTWMDLDMFLTLGSEVAPDKIYQAEAGTIAWTDPDLIKTLEVWKSLFDQGVIQKGALGTTQYPDADDAWLKGKALYEYVGTWGNFNMTKDGLKFQQDRLGFTDAWEIVPVPFPDVNGDGKPARLFGGPDVGIAVNNSSKAIDAAWTLAAWLASEDAQTILAANGNQPSVKGVDIDPGQFITEGQRAAVKQQAVDLANAAGKREFLYPDLKTALIDALQGVASGEQTPAEALAAVETVSKGITR